MRHVYANRATYILAALLVVGAAMFGWFRSAGIILFTSAATRAEVAAERAPNVTPEDGLPAGGRDLLTAVLDACADCDSLPVLASEDRSEDAWQAYFEAENVLAAISDAQIATLTAYLELHFPLEDIAHLEEGAEALPPDGRELLNRACQDCHPLHVSVRLDTDAAGWRDLLNDADHAGLLPSEQQVEELATYLAINAPSPDDLR